MSELCRLYIDESGDHCYYNFKEELNRDPSRRYLSLMGVILEEAERLRAVENFEKIKIKYFRSDPDYPVILHRSDIINKRRRFCVLQNKEIENEFNKELLSFLKNLECVLILVVIDKEAHIKRYGEFAFHPYHYAFTAMMERYCGYLNFHNLRGDIMAERRGSKEDESLIKEYRRRYEEGTHFRKPSFFQQCLTSKELKIKPKEANIFGLQIADILAHPCKQKFLIDIERMSGPLDCFGAQVCEAVKWKYNQQIYTCIVKGYGKVFLK